MKAFLPEGWLLPWWVVLLVTCYLLLKVGLSLEHPCSVLGVWSPVTRGQISKRYREISMCTHPDKLLGHTADEVERGKLLFQRASDARDGLIAATRESAAAIERAARASAIDGGAADGAVAQAEASCSTQLDEAIYQGLSYLLEASHEVGAYAMGQYVFDFFYRLLTFEFDVTGTISSVLLLMTLYRTLAGFVAFLRDSGPLSTLVAALTTCIVGPLPTLLRFLALPLLRVEVSKSSCGTPPTHHARCRSPTAALSSLWCTPSTVVHPLTPSPCCRHSCAASCSPSSPTPPTTPPTTTCAPPRHRLGLAHSP